MKNKVNTLTPLIFALNHHAYLVSGTCGELLASLGNLAFGSDFWRGDFDVFGIDDSRALKERASRKAMVEGGKKIFVISAGSFTVEAQNSLLKLFEDPTPDTHFFILTPSAKFLIPTLRSRLTSLALNNEVGQRKKMERACESPGQDFLKKTLRERMAMATKIAKEEYGKQHATELIESLITHIRSMSKNKMHTESDARTLHRLIKYREYLFGTSPSVKMIVEAAAFSV